MTRSQEFYHGTNAHLEPGDVIMPRAHTGIGESWKGNRDPKNRVWVTSHPDDAYKFAQQATRSRGGEPAVYQVEPIQRRPVAHFDHWALGLIEQHTATHATVVKRVR